MTKNDVRKLLEEKKLPFPHLKFFDQNSELVMKYIRKPTLRLVVSDEMEIPEEWQFKNDAAVLSHTAKREFTDLEKLEWIKCSLDCVYYCKKYIKITSVDDGLIQFKPHAYQIDMLKMFMENRFSIACLGRQLGKTTTVASYVLWYIHFHPSKQAAILANKADQAQEILERVQESYESLPLFIKPGVRLYNKRSMSFFNKSKAFSAASSKSGIRGKSISLLYWDEAAFTPNDTSFYESIQPTITSGKKTKLIMTSTPNGKRGVFYKIWSNPNSGFAKKLAIWSDNPTRDEQWKKETINATSYEAFLQEHCCEFRGSQNVLLSGECMMNLFHTEPEEIKDGNLRIYKTPEAGHIYVMCVDVSRGRGDDDHAFTIVDITKEQYEVVAVFNDNKLPTLMYPSLIYNVATYYNLAHVLVEINDIGEQVANDLYFDLEYENILSVVPEKSRQIIGFGGNSRPGVRTSTQVKAIGCSNIKTMIEKGKLILNDETVIDQFGTFVPHGSSFAAASGAKDDLVMTLVLFGWLSTQVYFIDLTDRDLKKSILKNARDMEMESITPFGIIDSEHYTYEGDVIPAEDSLMNGF